MDSDGDKKRTGRGGPGELGSLVYVGALFVGAVVAALGVPLVPAPFGDVVSIGALAFVGGLCVLPTAQGWFR